MALPELALVAARAAVTAGRAVMDVYARDFDVAFKDDQSPLTDADRSAHQVLMAALRETAIPVLSEESEDISFETRGAWPVLWLIDPLDGTKEFVKRNGDFTVNVALIVGGHPALGMVYAPAHDDLYIGVSGHGAFRGGAAASQAASPAEPGRQAVETPEPDLSRRWQCHHVFLQSLEKLGHDVPGLGDGSPLRVVASRSHGSAATESFVQRLAAEGRPVERVSRGSALKLCMVASGEADVYPRLAPTMEWDTAAAQAVVECAGGRVVVYDDALHAAFTERGPSALCAGRSLTYNRPDLLNPWFVAIPPHWSR